VAETLALDWPAPWSPAARDSTVEAEKALAGLVQSEVQGRLAAEIDRYAVGKVSGRAFLLAGHRGVGKTTTVAAAIQQVYTSCVRTKLPYRPLLVRLHGPSLVDGLRRPGEGTAGGDQEVAERASAYSQRFLREMAAGIFPALMDEVRRLLILRVGESTIPSAEHREMIAHLGDELSRGMTLAEVRELFRRLGLLPRGLFDQGNAFQELTALQSAGEAYLVVTGKLETEDRSGRDATRREEARRERTLSGDAWARALTPVASVLAGVGLAQHSVIAAAVTALGIMTSGLTLTRSSSRSRSSTFARSRSFSQDNTLESLVRRVPLLVEQLRSCGFPPIFVLDELDKLKEPPLDVVLDALLRNLKSYVTERSFICFIVERAYYERIWEAAPPVVAARSDHGWGHSKQSAPQPTPSRATVRYGVEHTFYSDAAYVVHRAPLLHEYLRQLLREDAAVSGSDDVRRSVEYNRILFRYQALWRARAHPYDLRRELVRVAQGSADAGFSDSAFDPPRAWRLRAFFQLAIEWVISKDVCHRRAEENPFVGQLLYDALYAVSDAWEREEDLPLSLTALGQLDASSLAKVLPATAQHADCELLTDAIVALLEFLRDPTKLRRDVHAELDVPRLERFLLGGEAKRTPSAALPWPPAKLVALQPAAQPKIGSDDVVIGERPLLRLEACFGTRKYHLLREVTGERFWPLLPPSSGFAWLIDRRGLRKVDRNVTRLEPYDLKLVESLFAFREAFQQRAPLGTEVTFAQLWDGAVVSSELALSRIDKAMSGAQNAFDVDLVKQAIPIVWQALRLIQLLVVGARLLQVVRGKAPVPGGASATPAFPAASALTLFASAVRSTNVASRRVEAKSAIDDVATAYGVDLSSFKATFEATAAPNANEPSDAALNGLVPSKVADTEWHAWLESIAQRLLAALGGAEVSAPVQAHVPKLDFLAAIGQWYPLSLRDLGSKRLSPLQWSIVACSELLIDAGKVSELRWLRLIALAQLGWHGPLNVLIGEMASQPHTDAIRGVLEWAQVRRSKLEHEGARILLLNPGAVMLEWLPEAGTSVVVTRSRDTNVADALAPGFDFVLCEGQMPAGVSANSGPAFSIDANVTSPTRETDGSYRLPATRTLAEALTLAEFALSTLERPQTPS
jgi:hypothetical protein